MSSLQAKWQVKMPRFSELWGFGNCKDCGTIFTKSTRCFVPWAPKRVSVCTASIREPAWKCTGWSNKSCEDSLGKLHSISLPWTPRSCSSSGSLTFHPFSPNDEGGGGKNKPPESICRNLLHFLHILIKKNKKGRADQWGQPYSIVWVVVVFYF